MTDWYCMDDPEHLPPRDGTYFLVQYCSDFGPPIGVMQWQSIPTKKDPDNGRFHSWAHGTQTAKALYWQPSPELRHD